MELFTWFEIIKCRKKKYQELLGILLSRGQRPRLRCAKVMVVWTWILTCGRALGTQLASHTQAQYSSL